MAATGLERRKSQPLWSQLRADVRRRIDTGDFVKTFPPELALMAEYGVSRYTVRQALQALRAEGVVLAGRGRLPRLASIPPIEQELGALNSLFATVEASGLEQRSHVRSSRVVADGVIATRLGLDESSPLVHVERLRLAGRDPIAVDEVWLPADLAAPLLDADLTHTSLYAELVARTGIRITDGLEKVRAVTPTPAHAQDLGITDDTPVLVVHRLGCDDRRPVEWRCTMVRGDMIAFNATFSARNGQAGEL